MSRPLLSTLFLRFTHHPQAAWAIRLPRERPKEGANAVFGCSPETPHSFLRNPSPPPPAPIPACYGSFSKAITKSTYQQLLTLPAGPSTGAQSSLWGPPSLSGLSL